MTNRTQSFYEEQLQDGIRYQRAGSLDRAVNILETVAASSPLAEEVAEAQYHLSLAHRRKGEWEVALRYARLSGVSASRAGSVRLQCQALNAEALCFYQQGKMEEAEGLYTRVLEVAPEEDMRSRGTALSNLGSMAGDRGEVSRAEALFTAALECFRLAEYEPGTLAALHNLGSIKLNQGEYDSALADFIQVRNAAEKQGDLELMGLATTNIAEAVARGGTEEGAQEIIGQAIGHFSAGNNHYRRCYALGVLADIAALRGDQETALRGYQVAREMSVQRGFRALELRFNKKLEAARVLS